MGKFIFNLLPIPYTLSQTKADHIASFFLWTFPTNFLAPSYVKCSLNWLTGEISAEHFSQPAQQAFQREFVEKVGTIAPFFCSRSNFRAIIRLETLPTQATHQLKNLIVFSYPRLLNHRCKISNRSPQGESRARFACQCHDFCSTSADVFPPCLLCGCIVLVRNTIIHFTTRHQQYVNLSVGC